MSLEEVSAATRISTRFLEAIETEKWDLLPGGVFNRGFIRSVARFLGLDEDSMVAEYALETRGRVDVGVVPDPPMEMPRNWKPVLVAAIAVSLILASAAFVYARYGGQISARLHRKAAPAAPAIASASNDANSAIAPSSAVVPDGAVQNTGELDGCRRRERYRRSARAQSAGEQGCDRDDCRRWKNRVHRDD